MFRLRLDVSHSVLPGLVLPLQLLLDRSDRMWPLEALHYGTGTGITANAKLVPLSPFTLPLPLLLLPVAVV